VLDGTPKTENTMTTKTLELGAQDPELKNSPVAWEGDEDTEALREEIPEEAECFFNGRAFSHDTVISSGSTRLRCDYGLWIPAGPGGAGKP
jgi:hypothetical protein